MQTAIPCLQIRGGTSKGLYFLASDLPTDESTRDAVLLAAMGSPDNRQIDGLGGATSLTSKVAIVSPSSHAEADVDYLFAQVVVEEARVDYGQNCGNILAGVAPFAIECGLVKADPEMTRVRVHMVNSEQLADIDVPTPHGRVEYEGDARISGVPGTAAPLIITFRDTAGANCGALLPTGQARDLIEGTEVTCIDNGMPVVIIRAEDLDVTGHESCEALEANETLRQRLEQIRLAAGPLMNLGDVTSRTVPKLSLIAPPVNGGTMATRTFIPHRCHQAIGVLGAVSVATVCMIEGSVAQGFLTLPEGREQRLSLEHPTGEFTVAMTLNEAGHITESGVLRTARLLAAGHVFVPSSLWPNAPATRSSPAV